MITYDGPVGVPPSPISGLPNPTRAYTITGLTNYLPYTVTLNAMESAAPVLTDTVIVRPTDLFTFMPYISRAP